MPDASSRQRNARGTAATGLAISFPSTKPVTPRSTSSGIAARVTPGSSLCEATVETWRWPPIVPTLCVKLETQLSSEASLYSYMVQNAEA